MVYFWNRSCISRKETLHFSTSHIFISDKHVCISKQVTYYKEVFLSISARHIHTVITLYLELPPKPGDHRNWQLCKCHYKKTGTPERGCRGGHCLSQGGAKDALFDIPKIFRIFKKIITCSLHEAKITNYEPLKRVLSQKPAPPLPPHIHTSFHRPCKKLILFIQFSAALSLCLFLQKIAGIN